MLYRQPSHQGVVYYELSFKTNPVLGSFIKHNWWDLSQHPKKNVPTTTLVTIQLFFCVKMLVAMLWRWPKPSWKHSVLHQPPYSPDIVPPDYWLAMDNTFNKTKGTFSYNKCKILNKKRRKLTFTLLALKILFKS